jgi:two-component system cell cycle sensor histidine kinase PleC
LIQLHGGTFDLQSELRKGTEVTVTLPRQRVLSSLEPLQPLGQERHRDPAPRPTRQPRMRPSSPYGADNPYRSAGTR